jgi:hypothetical protein
MEPGFGWVQLTRDPGASLLDRPRLGASFREVSRCPYHLAAGHTVMLLELVRTSVGRSRPGCSATAHSRRGADSRAVPPFEGSARSRSALLRAQQLRGSHAARAAFPRRPRADNRRTTVDAGRVKRRVSLRVGCRILKLSTRRRPGPGALPRSSATSRRKDVGLTVAREDAGGHLLVPVRRRLGALR